jgi:hypothetical protein
MADKAGSSTGMDEDPPPPAPEGPADQEMAPPEPNGPAEEENNGVPQPPPFLPTMEHPYALVCEADPTYQPVVGDVIVCEDRNGHAAQFEPIFKVDKYWPGAKMKHRADLRRNAPHIHKGDKEWVDLGPEPDRSALKTNEQAYQAELQYMVQAKHMPNKDELADSHKMSTERSILPLNVCNVPKSYLEKMNLPTKEVLEAKKTFCWEQKRNHLRYSRYSNGLVPIIPSARRWALDNRLESYGGEYIAPDSVYMTCAKLYRKDPKPVKLNPISDNFWKKEPQVPHALLNDDACYLPVQRREPNLPNMWIERHVDNTDRVRMNPVHLKMLDKILAHGDLREVDCDTRPHWGDISKWFLNAFREPRIIALLTATIRFSQAMLLMTAANIGWLNLESFYKTWDRYYCKVNSAKLREYLEYYVTVHALVINLIYEVLEAIQAESRNWPFLRMEAGAAADWVITPVSLHALTRYMAVQEIHAPHEIYSIPEAREQNQFIGIANGQVLRVGVLQKILIELQAVHYHHAMIMYCVYKSFPERFNCHDCHYQMAVSDLTSALWEAYTQSVAIGALKGTAVLRQRRHGWLRAPDAMATTLRGRLLPRTPFAHRALKREAIPGYGPGINTTLIEKEVYKFWEGVPSPAALASKQRQDDIDLGVPTEVPSILKIKATDGYVSSASEDEKEEEAAKETPLKIKSELWLTKPAANPITGQTSEKKVAARTKLVASNYGENAFVKMRVVNMSADMHPFNELPRTRTAAEIFCSKIEAGQIEETAEGYADAINRAEQAYDAMNDVNEPIDKHFKVIGEAVKQAAKAISMLKHTFTDSARMRTDATERLVRLDTALLCKGPNQPEAQIDWSAWFWARTLNTEWINTDNVSLSQEAHLVLHRYYTVLAQNYIYSVDPVEGWRLYLQAMLKKHNILPENRRFYVPSSDKELTICGSCAADLTVSPHITTCKFRAPHFSRAYRLHLQKQVSDEPATSLSRKIETIASAQEAEIRQFMAENNMSNSYLTVLSNAGNLVARDMLRRDRSASRSRGGGSQYGSSQRGGTIRGGSAPRGNFGDRGGYAPRGNYNDRGGYAPRGNYGDRGGFGLPKFGASARGGFAGHAPPIGVDNTRSTMNYYSPQNANEPKYGYSVGGGQFKAPPSSGGVKRARQSTAEQQQITADEQLAKRLAAMIRKEMAAELDGSRPSTSASSQSEAPRKNARKESEVVHINDDDESDDDVHEITVEDDSRLEEDMQDDDSHQQHDDKVDDNVEDNVDDNGEPFIPAPKGKRSKKREKEEKEVLTQQQRLQDAFNNAGYGSSGKKWSGAARGGRGGGRSRSRGGRGFYQSSA